MTDSFPQPLGGVRHLYEWRSHRVAYTVRGSGPAMCLVHSIHAAAWSMEWRNVVGPLSSRFTVFAIDLLGFGASERPPLQYTAELYVGLIHDFLRDVVQVPAVVVGSSLGGTYTLRVAATHPQYVRALAVIGPAGVSRLFSTGGAAGSIGSVVQRMFRLPIVGEALFSGVTSRASIRFFLRDIYHDPTALSPEVVELYWRAAQADGARFAPAAFVGMRLNCDIREDLRRLSVPIQILWGTHATQTPFKESAQVRALRPDAPFAALPGGDLPHDESPDAFLTALYAFLDPLD